ncbi:hypothetical protein CJ030_MR4G020432 [Morella rubra]|uniref:Uncharacterized protein n=1 Tax=Morella rubra TaxID=262757 RepID=A0A6A1VW19_9ROSI|nr:hypothetical protein CJ030_MR4G020432 [Morella rubra]
MAVWLARSRIIFHRLSKQMGVLGVVHNNSWKTSVHSSGSSAMSHGDKYGRPRAFMGNSASRFHLQRFKSTEVESELDSQYINENDDDERPMAKKMLSFIFTISAFNMEPERISLFKEEDGDTILHCAISRDYFAVPIGRHILRAKRNQCDTLRDVIVSFALDRYGISNNSFVSGPSRLYQSAWILSSPSAGEQTYAFRSGSHFGRFFNIIYQYCTFVDELKEEQYDNDYQPTDQSSNEEKNRNFPENYTTCLDFFLPVIHGVRNVRLCPKKEDRVQKDEENTREHGGFLAQFYEAFVAASI